MGNLQTLTKSSAMPLQAGIFLKSTEALDGTTFEKTTIFITEYNANGAVGFIINKPFIRRLNELDEFKSSPGFPIYKGGPVEQEQLFFIHQRPEIIEDGNAVDDIYIGGNFKQAVAAINNNRLTTADIKIFIGYCGWDGGELEAEIEEGSWVMAAAGEDVFMR